MKKILSLILILILITSVSFCDAGPKPQISVTVDNIDGSSCIIGLLTRSSNEDVWSGWINVIGDRQADDRLNQFNDDVISKAKELTNDRLLGVIVADIDSNSAKANYNYGTPDEFKILVIQENGETYISNIVERKAFDSMVKFDLKTGIAKEESIYFLALLMYIKTLIVTLLIEGVVLWSFGFSHKKF